VGQKPAYFQNFEICGLLNPPTHFAVEGHMRQWTHGMLSFAKFQLDPCKLFQWGRKPPKCWDVYQILNFGAVVQPFGDQDRIWLTKVELYSVLFHVKFHTGTVHRVAFEGKPPTLTLFLSSTFAVALTT